MKRILAMILITLGLGIALFSLPGSAALDQGRVDRQSSGNTAVDTSATLTLQGFEDVTDTITSIYSNVAYITNNTSRTISVRINISTIFSNKNKGIVLSIRPGTSATAVSIDGTPLTGYTTITIASGAKVTVQAKMTNNSNHKEKVAASFDFLVTEQTGAYTATILDSAGTPRSITFR